MLAYRTARKNTVKFLHLQNVVDTIPARYGTPGCAAAVTLGQETVFCRTAGYSDPAKTKSAARDDLYWIYSVTKTFTAAVAMRLREEGLIDLDAPVSRYLPEWEWVSYRSGDEVVPCRGPLVRELLTMGGGLNYDLDTPALTRYRQSDAAGSLREFSRVLAAESLDFPPGSRFQYSLCHDLLGAAMEVATGQPLCEIFRSRIQQKTGAPDMTFFPTPEQKARFACEYRYQPETKRYLDAAFDHPFVAGEAFASAGAGLCAGIDDLALFAGALANGGVARGGETILAQESIALMAKNHLGGAQKKEFHLMKPAAFDYGYGVSVQTAPYRGAPTGGFGWDGAAGAFLLVDSARKASLVYLQHVLDHWDIPARTHDELRDAFYLDLAEHGVQA